METYIVRIDGIEYEVEIEKKNPDKAHHNSIQESVNAGRRNSAAVPKGEKAAAENTAGTPVVCGTSGKVWKVESRAGDEVKSGDTVIIIEAMKMEIPVVAPCDGKVLSVTVGEGDCVASGQAVAYVG